MMMMVSMMHRLAHCLEHLIFMGTNKYPRGFLDLCAVACLSNGTNAYTAQDHCSYSVVTAGNEGMLSFVMHDTRAYLYM